VKDTQETPVCAVLTSTLLFRNSMKYSKESAPGILSTTMIKNCLNSRRLSLLSWGCFDFFFISSLAEVEIERKVNTTVEKNQENRKNRKMVKF